MKTSNPKQLVGKHQRNQMTIFQLLCFTTLSFKQQLSKTQLCSTYSHQSTQKG